MTDKEYLLEMGRRIKVARKERGVTVRKLSALTGFSYVNLNYVENGISDCHILYLKKIADALKMDARWLMP